MQDKTIYGTFDRTFKEQQYDKLVYPKQDYPTQDRFFRAAASAAASVAKVAKQASDKIHEVLRSNYVEIKGPK